MKCPICGGPTRVYDTKPRHGVVLRRRLCRGSACAYKFRTREKLLPGAGHYVPSLFDESWPPAQSPQGIRPDER